MEFVHGIKINDREALVKNNFVPSQVAYLFLKCFSYQIYVHGWIHSDPHPGNLLVRRKNGATQIVVLDHGLYER